MSNFLLTREKPAASRRAKLIRVACVLVLYAGLPLATVGVTALLGAIEAVAQKEPSIEELRRRLKQGQESLATTRAREKALLSSKAAAIAEREDLTGRSIMKARQQQETERRLTAIEAKLAALEARLAELKVEEEDIQRSLEAQKHKIAGLLAAMQRMGRNPPPVIVTRRTDALSMVRSAMLLARAFPELRTEARQLTETLKKRIAIRQEQERRKADQLIRRKQQQDEKIRLERERQDLDGVVEKKRQLIARYSSDLDAIAIDAAKKSREIKTLSELIASLDKTVSARTRLGDYNRSIQSQPKPDKSRVIARAPPATAPSPSPSPSKPGSDPGLRTLAPLDGPTATLVPSATSVPLGAGRLTPAIPFQKAIGKLPMPTAGRLVLGFNERTRIGRKSRGVVFETRPNARITSPADGWVVYAGTFRSYGKLLIINAGGGYHIVMAGLSRIDVQLGQFILASEPVGAMGSAPASGQDGSAPVLYVEFRKGGRPINPTRWWAKDQKVAQR
ncbi:MAG: peptidoglycan DD-metalloendopeptidase family protein [Pseudomonadota bacterium]